MLLSVKDASGEEQIIIVGGQATPTNHSGTIAVNGQSQIMIPADPGRSGFYFQNRSPGTLQINEIGSATDAAAFSVPPGGTFPPCGYPTPTGDITVAGPFGAAFAARSW